MRFGNQSPLLLSIEDVRNIGTPAGGAPDDGGSLPAPPATLDQKIDAAFASPPQGAVAQPAPAAPPAPETIPAQPATPAQVQPAPVVEAPSAIPTPESYLSPIFDLAKLPLNEAAPQAVEQMRTLATYDPKAFNVLLNGVYGSQAETLRQWVLDDLGVKKEDVGKFTDWRARGGGELAAPVYFAPFPVPDSDPNSPNYGLVTLPGIGVVDTKAEFGQQFYDNAKFKYETEAGNAKATYEKQQTDARTAEQQRVDAEIETQRKSAERSDTFMRNTIQAIDSQIAKVLPQLAPEDAWKVRAVKAYAFAHVQDMIADPTSDVAKLLNEAAPYVSEGAGRTADYQQQVIDLLSKAALAETERFNLEILRGNQAQRALAVAAPVLPPGTTVITGAQLPDDKKPTTRREWEQQGLSRVEAGLANL